GENPPTAFVQKPARPPKYLVEHRLREEAGLRVPLARMVGCNQFDRGQGDGRRMPQPRFRDRHIVTNRPPGPEEGVHRDRPEGDDHAQGGEEPHLPLEIRLAVAELRRRGSVSRWSTSHRGSYVAIPERGPLRSGDLLAVSYQAGAAAAANDLGRDAFQGIATAYHRPFRRFTHNRRLPQSIEN